MEVYAHVILPTFETPWARHYADGTELDYVGGVGAGLRVTFQPFSRGLFAEADDRVGFFAGIGYSHLPVYVSSTPVTETQPTARQYESDEVLKSVLVPVGLRWLIPMSAHFALFLEPGLLVFVRPHGLALDPSDKAAGISPTGALGLQVPIGRHAAFTLRAGYPMLLTLGASWLP